MRLTLKLALAVLPGALLVVAAAALLELRRDRAEFEADQRSDDQATAGAFADSMGKMWDAVGEQPVRRAMDRLATFEARYRVGWIDLARADGALPARERAAVARGQAILWRETDGGRPGWLHAVSPVRADGRVVGAVDVSEPPPDLRAHVRRTIRATLVATLALAATMMLMTLLVGAWVVGGPIAGLISQARRVAAGDLGARSVPRQQDELGELTRELNGMLDRLEGAAAEVQASTRQRFDALEQLRHAERLTTVGRLASSVAHELGTPLNVVTGRARLIVEDEREAKTHARIIIDQGERMTKIIRQLLDYARRRPPQKGEQDLSQLAADVLPLLSTLASKKRVRLEFHAEVANAPVTADATQVQQALTNLIVNAIQASADGATVDVTLRAAGPRRATPDRQEDGDGPSGSTGTFELAVRDHGPGMPPEVLARVFEPFFTTKPIGESTGLGLSVTHDIVDEHGGWIEADSAPGRGSRFSMFLPRRAA
ncbi:MAG TPA: HAMP domain-containing sensor histidine kinase [Polyangia bacterium]|nr:HAMP domain-containing sensor histidine kinase [Polyangia bacterium]